MQQAELDQRLMRRALELAERGRGAVEPNPLVGCLIVRGAEIIGEGWHRRYGGPHAEIEALTMAGGRAAGATVYVTLEPCCHQGKTPPCTDAIVAAKVQRVVVAQQDPYPKVAGGGLRALQAAGLDVSTGVCEAEARRLNAPYLRLLAAGRPWIIAKWAMTLDGRIATAQGDSRWISNERSRAVAHAIRGRVDAIVVGRGTATIDDPLLTARPSGPRVASRIVLDSQARLDVKSQLVRTVADAPVLVAVAESAPGDRCAALRAAGCEVLACQGSTPAERLASLLDELGRRRMTNVLVEGGSGVLGSFFDAGFVDEVHAFISTRIVGGKSALGPIGGDGVQRIDQAFALDDVQVTTLDGDLYVVGIKKSPSP